MGPASGHVILRVSGKALTHTPSNLDQLVGRVLDIRLKDGKTLRRRVLGAGTCTLYFARSYLTWDQSNCRHYGESGWTAVHEVRAHMRPRLFFH
jgi:hypothetical protein